MIEQISALPDNVVGFRAKGEVTSDDYEQRLVPAIEHALATHDKIRLLYVLGSDFTGYSGGAMWEDGKVGMEHLTRWERIAVVSNQPWIRHAVNILGYLIPGRVKAFELAEENDAAAWITG
jgi:SpoIIAA-like